MDLAKLRKIKRMTKNSQNDEKVREIFTWAFEIMLVLVLAIVVALFFFTTVTMREGSMEPTISAGDKFFVNKMAYKFSDPERGDMIVFRTSPNEDAAYHIKRVIGLPGETIQIKDGQILINGETYKEGRGFPVISNPGLAENEIQLETDEFFVLGDNRNNSEDSRYGDVGNVSKKYMIGKLWFQVSPWKRLGFLKN